jgi:hypothetical protein
MRTEGCGKPVTFHLTGQAEAMRALFWLCGTKNGTGGAKLELQSGLWSLLKWSRARNARLSQRLPVSLPQSDQEIEPWLRKI